MFAILIKDVDGRRFDRYFKKWNNARDEVLKEIKDVKEHFGCREHSTVDRMNTAKGVWEYEEMITTCDGSRFHWAVVGGYFQD